MKTGILGGFLTGSALSLVALGGASLLTYPEVAAPDATAVDVPAGSEFRQSREDTEAKLPASDETPDPQDKPQIQAPEPDDLASLDQGTTAPAAQPSTGSADAGLIAPDAPDAPSGIVADEEEPVLPSPQALAPQAPSGEGDPSISTEPAQPVQPDIEESGVFEDDEQAAVTLEDEAAPEDAVEPEATPEPDAQGEDPPAPEPETAQQPEQAPDVQTEVAEPAPAPEPEPDPEVTTVVEPEPQPKPDAEPQVEAEPEAEVETEQAAAPQKEQAGTIGNIAEGVTVGRLPSVGGDEAESEDVTDEAAPVEGPQTPLHQFSAEFENLDGKPLMSFVLLDNGDTPIDFEALAEFPYPISYAVDVTWPGAGAAMDRYRAAGLEVLAMIDLPEGANAVDTEVAMQTYLSQLPETVAVMEGVGSGLQSTREATEQLIPILKESGHGLVLFSEGFDTAQKLIAREGVPALTVFRDIDSKDQTATVIRRFLDQAAFRAGQEETGVIIVGRLRAETVSALLLWGLQDRANSVAIAPVSALLKAQSAE